MDLIREYWWLIVIVVALVLAFILLRPKQRVQLTDSAPVRPHMTQTKGPPEGRGLVGEAVAATSEFAGDLISAPVRQTLEGDQSPGDDFSRMKGVGPRFGDALHRLGFNRFEQLASLTPAEIARLDAQLGAFSGRITRDRVVEQADYLARGDADGFEQRFGRL